MGKQLEVKVRVDHNNEVVVNPWRVAVCESAGDEIVWRCDDGQAEVRFKNKKGGTPFESGTFVVPHGGGALSGPARRGKSGKTYYYSVTVTIPGLDPSDQPDPIDPEVQVDP
jgi:hypothetical protein